MCPGVISLATTGAFDRVHEQYDARDLESRQQAAAMVDQRFLTHDDSFIQCYQGDDPLPIAFIRDANNQAVPNIVMALNCLLDFFGLVPTGVSDGVLAEVKMFKKLGKKVRYFDISDLPRSLREVTEEEVSSFIGENAENYIQKFRRFNVDGVDKFSWTWHWPAFFFGFWWLLYRKLYVWALIAFLLLMIPYWFFLNSFVYGVIANYIYYKQVKKKITQKKKAAASLVRDWPQSY